MINRSPFGSSLACEALRLGWCCLNSPMAVRHGLNWESRPLRITGILFGIVKDFGRTGVMGGCSGDLVSCRVGGVGGPGALRFLRLRCASVSSSSWLAGGMVWARGGWGYVGVAQMNYGVK